MSAVEQPGTLPVPEGSGLAVRFVLAQVSRALELLYRTGERLCCSDPELAKHVRCLADQCAAAALDSVKRWPS